jgi:hypothetical protein
MGYNFEDLNVRITKVKTLRNFKQRFYFLFCFEKSIKSPEKGKMETHPLSPCLSLIPISPDAQFVKLKWSEVDITNVAAIHVSWRFGSMMPPT